MRCPFRHERALPSHFAGVYMACSINQNLSKPSVHCTYGSSMMRSGSCGFEPHQWNERSRVVLRVRCVMSCHPARCRCHATSYTDATESHRKYYTWCFWFPCFSVRFVIYSGRLSLINLDIYKLHT